MTAQRGFLFLALLWMTGFELFGHAFLLCPLFYYPKKQIFRLFLKNGKKAVAFSAW